MSLYGHSCGWNICLLIAFNTENCFVEIQIGFNKNCASIASKDQL